MIKYITPLLAILLYVGCSPYKRLDVKTDYIDSRLSQAQEQLNTFIKKDSARTVSMDASIETMQNEMFNLSQSTKENVVIYVQEREYSESGTLTKEKVSHSTSGKEVLRREIQNTTEVSKTVMSYVDSVTNSYRANLDYLNARYDSLAVSHSELKRASTPKKNKISSMLTFIVILSVAGFVVGRYWLQIRYLFKRKT